MKILRISYVENYKFGSTEMEAYVYETKRSEYDEWGFAYACGISESGAISYEALTQIRHHMNLGYKVIWA